MNRLARAGLPALAAPLLLAATLAGCDLAYESAGPVDSGNQAPTPAGSEAPSSVPSGAPSSESPAASPGGGGALDPAVPTACIDLDEAACATARDLAAAELAAGDPSVVYVQVGPFGCSLEAGCPPDLTARPEGDVTLEFDDGTAAMVHLIVGADGTGVAERQPAAGIAVDPVSPAVGAAGESAFTLGHCGIFSGFDFDGAYWDPVGPLTTDSGHAINETAGVLTVADADHATFATPDGFSVDLQRRDGPKFLPFCM
jgi:hypothetical protein